MHSGGSSGKAHPPRPLFLDQTGARRDEKTFFETPLSHKGLDAPPPPLCEGLDAPLMRTSRRFSWDASYLGAAVNTFY